MKKIRVIIKNIYGNEMIYPLDFKAELKQLTGKKTLSINDVKALKAMGFEVEQTMQEKEKLF